MMYFILLFFGSCLKLGIKEEKVFNISEIRMELFV